MRRNNNMGMGMGGRGGGGGGPLMTNHLQDLELELELLKRKRQLIQQQQNEILYRPNARQMAYDPPRQMYDDRFDAPPRRDFPSLYEEPPRGAPKRRPVAVWADAPGERPEGPSGFPKRPRQGPQPPARLMRGPPPQSRPAPLPSLLGPKPLMGFFQRSPKGQASRPAAFQTKFKQNVRPTGPNKPNSTPKKTPNKPTPNRPPGTPLVRKPESESFILTADVKPRSKIGGRLEFALGAILKEMKTALGDTDERKALLATPALARVVKHALRERLRGLMLGKAVGSGQEVLAQYRAAFPPATDAELFKLAEVEKADQNQKGELAIKLLEEGDPELYFKKNVTKLLEVKLAEMFEKIEKSYSEPSTSEIVENLPEVTKEATEESLKVDDAKETVIPGAKKHPKEEEYDKWIALLVERKLPQLLAKHKDDIIRVLDLDSAFRATKAAVVMHANNRSLRMASARHDFSKLPDSSKDDPELPQHLSYFAKVHANPSMPKRKLMQDFLNQFSPKTIKRHKKNFNLLFVGFANKEDYDRILKADQTKIGNATITILGNAPKADQSSVIEIKDDDRDSLDQLLTPQLDDQINDLLSSIRKADESSKEGETTNGDAKEDSTENGTTDANGHDSDVEEVNADAEVVAVEDEEPAIGNEEPAVGDEEAVESDVVAPLPSEEAAAAAAAPAPAAAPATPAKAKAAATPSTIRTRRASRLAQNN